MRRLLLAGLLPVLAVAQEAASGLDVRATLSVAAFGSGELTSLPRAGSVVDGGFRAVFYPTWKINEHWSVAGAFQTLSRPYFYETFETQGHGVKGNLLAGAVTWAQVSQRGSIVVRAGQLQTAFGSFGLRYDDAVNPLIGQPPPYGYYYAPVSTLGLAGAEVDMASGKWDGRAQFVNSSPANPKSVFSKGQYGNWSGGTGYSIRQGFRVGVSLSRGPYLDRKSPYFFPGEADPRDLSAHAVGIDVQAAAGHWNLQGEWQSFVFPYRAIPTFREQGGYAELKRVLHPRWYAAARTGYTSSRAGGRHEALEVAAGFRPNRSQLIKLGYELDYESTGIKRFYRTFGIQVITTIHPLSVATK